MLYMIGGASRAGKTILAQRLLNKHQIPWLGIDVLRLGLHHGAPRLALDPERDDLEEADRLWPIVRAMARSLIETGATYCLEGVCLRPRHVAELGLAFPGRVRGCFLGYPSVSLPEKLALVRTHRGSINDWLAEKPPEMIGGFLAHGIARSGAFQLDCKALGIPFFDTGEDFEAALAAAERSMVPGAANRQPPHC